MVVEKHSCKSGQAMLLQLGGLRDCRVSYQAAGRMPRPLFRISRSEDLKPCILTHAQVRMTKI
eukprot:scaffold22310_cov21-Tisochrysis_lutea.AAC.2